jgi:hypothetical protein
MFLIDLLHPEICLTDITAGRKSKEFEIEKLWTKLWGKRSNIHTLTVPAEKYCLAIELNYQRYAIPYFAYDTKFAIELSVPYG